MSLPEIEYEIHQLEQKNAEARLIVETVQKRIEKRTAQIALLQGQLSEASIGRMVKNFGPVSIEGPARVNRG